MEVFSSAVNLSIEASAGGESTGEGLVEVLEAPAANVTAEQKGMISSTVLSWTDRRISAEVRGQSARSDPNIG